MVPADGGVVGGTGAALIVVGWICVTVVPRPGGGGGGGGGGDGPPVVVGRVVDVDVVVIDVAEDVEPIDVAYGVQVGWGRVNVGSA